MSLATINADHAAARDELAAVYGRTVIIGTVSVTGTVHTRSRSDGYDGDGGRDIPENITVVADAGAFTAAQLAAHNQDTIVELDNVRYRWTGQTATDEVLSITATTE